MPPASSFSAHVTNAWFLRFAYLAFGAVLRLLCRRRPGVERDVALLACAMPVEGILVQALLFEPLPHEDAERHQGRVNGMSTQPAHLPFLAQARKDHAIQGGKDDRLAASR